MVPASNVIPSPNIDKSIFEIPFTAYFKAAADRLEDSDTRKPIWQTVDGVTIANLNAGIICRNFNDGFKSYLRLPESVALNLRGHLVNQNPIPDAFFTQVIQAYHDIKDKPGLQLTFDIPGGFYKKVFNADLNLVKEEKGKFKIDDVMTGGDIGGRLEELHIFVSMENKDDAQQAAMNFLENIDQRIRSIASLLGRLMSQFRLVSEATQGLEFKVHPMIRLAISEIRKADPDVDKIPPLIFSEKVARFVGEVLSQSNKESIEKTIQAQQQQ